MEEEEQEEEEKGTLAIELVQSDWSQMVGGQKLESPMSEELLQSGGGQGLDQLTNTVKRQKRLRPPEGAQAPGTRVQKGEGT